jgi:hypothetical protein
MFPSIKPNQTQAWKNLQSHYNEAKAWHLKDLFKNDPSRFEKYSIRQGDILVDYSKNIINDNTLDLLITLANECKLKEAYRSDVQRGKDKPLRKQAGTSHGSQKLFRQTRYCRWQGCDGRRSRSTKTDESFLRPGTFR